MSKVLLIDAGQSGIKCEIWFDDELKEKHRLGPVFTNHPLAPQFLSVISQLAGSSGAFDEIVISSSGVTNPHEVAAATAAGLGFKASLKIVHDSVGSLVVHCGLQGVVCAAGTGIVTFSASDSGTARVDGWGHSMGDGGSGFWIGKAGLEAAMKFFDGRGPKTSLLAELEARFGEPSAAYVAVQSDPAWVSVVASFAEVVLSESKSDEVSRKILLAAAAEMATSVITAAKRTSTPPTSGFKVALVGQVFSNETLREEVKSRVREHFPECEFVGLADSLLALRELNKLEEGHPLFSFVGSA